MAEPYANDPQSHDNTMLEDEEEEEMSEVEEEDIEGDPEDDEEEEEESMMSESWISNFCAVLGHEYFAEVSEDFIEDDFNLTGLSTVVPLYKEALEMILDVEPEETSEEGSEVDPESDNYNGSRKKGIRMGSSGANLAMVETSAELLYGLVHQRYILSRPGMQQMYDKYLSSHFGHCPRVLCNNARVLPCGTSDSPGQDTVKLFCPCCLDVYIPPNSRFQQVDGAFFGSSFASLFMMTFTDVDLSAPTHKVPGQIPPASRKSSTTGPSATAPTAGGSGATSSQPSGVLNGFAVQNIAPGLGTGKQYEMKIYGFKVSERSKSGPRMKWLRSKPDDINALDEAAVAEAKRTRPKKKKGPTTAQGGDQMDLSPVPPESPDTPRRVMRRPVRRIRAEDGSGTPR